MANDMNMVALIGRLTRDAEMRFTNGGMAIASFSIAVNKRKKNGDQWEDEATTSTAPSLVRQLNP